MSKNPSDPTGMESLAILVGSCANLAFDGWIVMLLLGALHTSYLSVPPVGYGFGVFIAWALSCCGGSSIFSLTQRVKKLATLL